jgi:hypothetical protein
MKMIYAKNITVSQRKALEEYEAITGFEPTHQEALDSGEMSFMEVWSANEAFIFSIYATVQNICVDN